MSAIRDNTRVLRALRELENMFGSREADSTGSVDDTIARRLSFGESMSETRIDTSSTSETKSAEAEIRALKAELLQCRAEITRLTMQKEEEEPARKTIVLGYTRELDTLQEHLQKERDVNAELKQQVIKALEKEAEDRAEIAQLRQQMKNRISELEERWQRSQALCLDLQQQLDQTKESAQETTFALEEEVQRLSASQVMIRTSLEEAKDQAEILKRHIREKELLISHLQSENSELRKSESKARELQRRLDELKQVEELSRIMRDELKRLPLVEKERAKLQEEVEQHRLARMNVHLIQERLLAAQHNTAKVKELQTLNTQLQVNVEQLQEQLEKWKELAAEPHGLMSPTAVLQCLADLRHSELALTERQSKLLAENETLRSKAETSSQELRRTNAKLVKVQSQFDEQTALLRRMQRRLLLLGKEREAYRAMIESYQKEAGPNWPAAAAKQIQFLENVLTDYRHSLEQVDKELHELRCQRMSDSTTTSTEVQTDDIQFADAKPEDPSYRIVHLAENPLEMAFRQRVENLNKLEEENERLRARIKVLEEFGHCQDVTAQVQLKLDQDGALPDRKSLQDQLASAEAKNRRLVDAFRRTSQDFRQGCYALTGYRIDVLSQGHYRLTHMYADSPDDYLLFQNAQQKMNVLETDYLRQLGGLASTYLEKYDSIPAFLSALTLKLFARQNDLEDSQL
ncbi:mitotic spindle assembly checkpoint protein MAD1 [Rhipicephalus sanguineus]|uniref:mitotic spindle assembly checkpoint protein MAD1 n=1 Tax=Rhipicephalus sanguineus TaxID=34632 RepID=UPI001896123F|nr:mitotic spindle assembly checkpoint protein MAD1 [Rhipicephalus sanguineus]